MFSPLHLSSLDTQKIFQNIILSAQWIVIPEEWSSPAAWSEDELPRVQDIDLSGRTVSME